MSEKGLADSYLVKARARLKALDTLMDLSDFSDVVRQAQELVELALRALLRLIGVEPAKTHHVAGLLRECADRLESLPLEELIRISQRLRKGRDLAFYGGVDFLPEEEYGQADGDRARDEARRVLEAVVAFRHRRRAEREGGD